MQAIAEGAPFLCRQCGRALTQAYVPAAQTAPRSNGLLVPVALAGLLLAGLAAAGYFFFANRQSSPAAIILRPNAETPPMLRLSGSNTIGAELGPALVEAWLVGRGAQNLHREQSGPDEMRISGVQNGRPVVVQVNAHGSATAFTDLSSGACDIGMASRAIKPEEAEELKARGLGDLTSEGSQKVLGLDGVAIIVSESNTLPGDSMQKEEVARIFAEREATRHWNLYARDDKSGTWDTFKDRVLGTLPLGSAKRFEDSRQLVDAVARDPDGIGFVGLTYAIGVKVLKIADKGAIPLRPNKLTIRTEDYPLSRRLYFYLPANAKPEARDFVRYALSAPGQDVVEKQGFVGQKPEIAPQTETPANAPAGYTALMPQSDRLTQDFRFRTGSSELEPKAVDDLKRLTSAMASEFSGRSIILIGFSDSVGNAAANKALSVKRAQAVAEQLKQEGITPALVEGFGAELPVADNGSPEGREKNRRVEVWLRK
jgi:phosphate transport system substrate-binding protein